MADLRVALVLGVRDLISGGLGRIENKIQELESRTKELDDTLKTLKGFKEVTEQIERLEEKEKELIRRHKALKAQKEALQEKLKALERAFKSGALSQEEYKAEVEKLRREVARLEAELEPLEQELRQTAREKEKLVSQSLRLRQELQKLGVEVSQVDQKIEEYEKELRKLSQTTERASKLSKSLKEGLSLLPGAGIFAGLSHEVLSLEGAVRSVMAQTAVFRANTEEELKALKENLKKDVLEIKKATGVSFTEIEEKLVQLIHGLGKYDESVKEAAKTALMLEKLTKGRLEGQELVRALTQASKNFGIPIEKVADYVFAVYQKVGDQAGDLLDTFWEYSDALRDAGITAEEFSAVLIAGARAGAFNFDKLGDILKEGFKASLAEASTLQEILRDLEKKEEGLIDQLFGKGTKEWTELKSAFVDYVQAVKSGNKELAKVSFAKITALLAEAYKKDATKAKELIQKVFGTIGAEDVGVKVLEAIAKALSEPEKYLEGVKEVKKAYEESLSPIQKLGKALDATFTQLVEAATPYIEVLAKGLEKVAGFIEKHRTLASVLLGGVGAFTALAAAVKGASIAYGVFKRAVSALFVPFKLFRKSVSNTCKASLCLQKVPKKLSLGLRIPKLPALKSPLLPSLGKLGKLGLKALRIGRLALGLSSPLGLALAFGPELVSLLKKTEVGEKLINGLKEAGRALWGGVKAIFSKPSKTVEAKRETIEKTTREAIVTATVEQTTEKLIEKQSPPVNITVNFSISSIAAVNPEELIAKIKAEVIPEVVRLTQEVIERELRLSESMY